MSQTAHTLAVQRRATVIAATAAVSCLLTGCLMLTWGATPAGGLPVHGSPGGAAVGSWNGSVAVLAVDGDWALVSMSGWVSAANVDAQGADGYRVQGSPAGGLWAVGVRIREDWSGDAEITGRILNTTGQDLEGYLFVEIVLLDEEGLVIGTELMSFEDLPNGGARAFSEATIVDRGEVAAIEFQM